MSKVLELLPSSVIDVFFDFANKSNKIQCRYVGCSKGAFLVVRYPKKMAESGWKDAFVEGNILNFRAVANREALEVIGFECTILRNIGSQERLLILSFPTEVDTRKLRTEPRISVEIMAKLDLIEKASNSKWSLIRDVSLSGSACEYNLEFPEDSSAEDIEIIKETELSYNDERVKLTINMEMYGDATVYEIPGTIKNIQIKDKVLVGVKFDEDSADGAEAFYNRLVLEGINS